MHHARPLSNFGKRSTLFDRLLGTYVPPPLGEVVRPWFAPWLDAKPKGAKVA